MALLSHYIKLTAFLLMLSTLCHAQSTGITGVGTATTTRDTFLANNGFIEAWDARGGFVLGGGGVETNIVQWRGIQGSEHYWVKFTTNFPAMVSSITTNNFPAVNFDRGSTNILRNYTLAPLFTGQKAGSVVMLYCGHQNAITANPFTLGYTQATNSAASFIGIAPHVTTPTSYSLRIAQNTNSNTKNISISGGNTTNRFNWYAASWSNNVGVVMQSLACGTESFTSDQMDLDTATLGGVVRGSEINANLAIGHMSFFAISTNFNNGTSLTNIMNYMNATYANGYFKVY